MVTRPQQVERRTESSPVKDRRSTTEPRNQPLAVVKTNGGGGGG